MPDGGGDQTHMIALLWGRRYHSSKGPRPALSVDRIARTAVGIADADGLAAVSMQRVAAELNFTKMALYRYLASKDELLAVMIDAAIGPPPVVRRVPDGWRPRVEEWARQMRATWLRHPWLQEATVAPRVMGPNEVGWCESAFEALSASGLASDEQRDAVVTLLGHVRSFHSTMSAGSRLWDADGEVGRQLQQVLEQDERRFPTLLAAVRSTAGPTDDDAWRFGLRCILDGLAMRVAEGASRRAG